MYVYVVMNESRCDRVCKDSGKCKTNKKYCSSKGLPYCNGDCYIPPLQWVSEQVFGTTLGRTIAQASPERWIVEGACKLEEE